MALSESPWFPNGHNTLSPIPLQIWTFSGSWTGRNPYNPFQGFIQYQLLAKFAGVIVDIGMTNKFPVTPFVALSHSRGRETVRLLHDFDDTISPGHPSHHLHWKMSIWSN